MDGTLNTYGVISGALSAMGSIHGNMSASASLFGEITMPEQIVRIGNYEELENLPQIEGVTLIGNKTFPQLHLSALTNMELDNLLT